MGTSAEQMTEYSAFSDGFISSLRNWAICLFALKWCRLVVPWFCYWLSGTEELLLVNMFVVCKFAKVVLRIIFRRFDILRSVFLCLAFNWPHISGFTFTPFMSEQFGGRLHFSTKLLIFSGDSFLSHRFLVTSANSFYVSSPVASSSS